MNASSQPSPSFRHISALLIANRGEVASRIIRTCRKMGIRTIAVFSDADRQSAYVKEADTAIWIGPSEPSASYLDQEKILEAAIRSEANAIHPGYGFLSENASFARRCEEEGICFIGPNPEAIEAMGDKAHARKLMQEHAVPVVPGMEEESSKNTDLLEMAKEIGFPLLLKAAAGGGGKGMRLVSSEEELPGTIVSARREALSAFGNDKLILEKYIASGRHIEFQIIGDQHGNLLHLHERECSIQRRYQKIIEESPSPVMNEDLRKSMSEAALRAASAIAYDNAGTVEFIYDEVLDRFYFLEVNTRLQVEHPVTEAITGLDLVQLQIESAQGLPLSIQQEEVHTNGYAIQCRLYAEDPAQDFRPLSGVIQRFEIPSVDGLRVESAVESASTVSVFYDPMIAKLIVWADNRYEAVRKMQYSLRKLICLGTQTNQSLLLRILENEDFQAGCYDTHFLSEYPHLLHPEPAKADSILFSAFALSLWGWHQREQKRHLLANIPSGWRNSFYQFQEDVYLYEGKEVIVHYRYLDHVFIFKMEDKYIDIQLIMVSHLKLRFEAEGRQYTFELAEVKGDCFVHNESLGMLHFQPKLRFPIRETIKSRGAYLAPMPSRIIDVLVHPGQTVREGQGLLVISSMKMETSLNAHHAGIVEEVFVREGQTVEAGFELLRLSELDS